MRRDIWRISFKRGYKAKERRREDSEEGAKDDWPAICDEALKTSNIKAVLSFLGQ